MNIRRGLTFFFFLYTAVCVPAYCRAEVTSSLWQTDKSQHFIINYQEAPAGYINRLVAEGEKYYSSIVDAFGYRRFDFWSWDNRAKIYLYRGSEDYIKDSKRTDWSGASVNVKSRLIKTFIGQENFFDSILPHEMAHIIFREFIGAKPDLPLWIEEGVACSQEKSTLVERLKVIKYLISRGSYLGLNKLSSIKDYALADPKTFYPEAASLIVFLLRQYGADSFLDFSRRIRDGEKWEQSLLKSYRFANLREFEDRWKEYFMR